MSGVFSFPTNGWTSGECHLQIFCTKGSDVLALLVLGDGVGVLKDVAAGVDSGVESDVEGRLRKSLILKLFAMEA